jgi:cell division septal protein FtsQ
MINTAKEAPMSESNRSEVTVVDIKMPFMSIVIFLVKAAIASIPAFIILTVIFGLMSVLLSGLFQSLGMGNY